MILDAEFSEINEIERADLESKRKGWNEEPVEKTEQEKEEEATTRAEVKEVVNKRDTKKKAARHPAPAPAPFTFAGSGFTSLEDAAASGQFVDLSGGRSSCLKRVDEAGLDGEGKPAKGSKVQSFFVEKAIAYVA